jgi:hypothetical protein
VSLLLLQLLLLLSFLLSSRRGSAVAVASSYLCDTAKTLVISTEVVRSHRMTQWRDPRISCFTRPRLHSQAP